MADIFRTIKNKNYTVMSNHHLQNPNLSLKAMGLMSKVLSLPDDWSYSVKGLAAYCKDGYESVRTALCELEKEGYLVRRRIRGERGKITGTEYIFRETPEMDVPGLEQEEGSQGEQGNANPSVEKIIKHPEDGPGLENPIVVKKEEKTPGSENPIMVKKQEKTPPGSDFPSTENRDQQNTKEQNINNNNIYTNIDYNLLFYSSSSTSGKINKINKTRNPEEEEKKEKQVQVQIQEQIGYEQLCASYGHEILDLIVKILKEIYLQGESDLFYTISQNQVPIRELKERLSKIRQGHVKTILEGIATGPPVRNPRRYLLTALYQADTAAQINAIREEVPAEEKLREDPEYARYDSNPDFRKILVAASMVLSKDEKNFISRIPGRKNQYLLCPVRQVFQIQEDSRGGRRYVVFVYANGRQAICDQEGNLLSSMGSEELLAHYAPVMQHKKVSRGGKS